MVFTPKKKGRFFIRRILDKRNSFIKSENFSSSRALNFLNIAQFFGVVNDNVFKFLTVFLLIDIHGLAASSKILFWVGTVYVLPFLIFSSGAGVFADKFSKQKMIVILKAIEVLTTALAVIAFSLASSWACYTLLFLLSFHSAAFGPPKYSIIPEIVHSDKISKANGIITSFTYLGIIVGTFLASFITQVSGKNFTIASSMCVVIALLGFGASLFIPYTQPAKTKARVKLFFLKEIYNTLSFCYRTPHLLVSILGAAFFLYLGAFFQLNIIPFAMEALSLSEVGGGYLFLTVAIGIAIGAILVGKLSKQHVELGFSCIAGFFLFFLVFALAVLPKIVFLDVILLILIGFFSGFFIVPFDAYIQKYSPDTQRGHVVATSNFMSFCGVLLAPISIYTFSGVYGLSAAQGFFVISLFVIAVSLLTILRLSGICFNWMGRVLLPTFYNISFSHPPFDTKRFPLLIIPHCSLKTLCLIAGGRENTHFFVLRNSFKPLDIVYRWFASIDIIYLKNINSTIKEYILKKNQQGKMCALCVAEDLDLKTISPQIALLRSSDILYVHTEETSSETRSGKSLKKQILLSFLDAP